MTVPNLSFRITADLAGFNAGMSQVTSTLRGVADRVRGAFQQSTAQVQTSTATVGTGISTLATRLGGLAVAFAALRSVQAFARISDEATLATARIDGLTGSVEQTRQAQAALFEMSQRLQAGYAEAVSSFSRMLPAVTELGGGVKETTSLTEILLTTAKLSGASATEAAASATQFAQGLASGVLQGDELKSILENNSTLARTLAEGLGVGVGELRRMGEEGKLTADLVANTLLGAYDDIKAKAADLPSTVGGAWTQIRNAFSLFITSVNEGTGVFGSLALVMTEMAKIITIVARAMFSAGEDSDRLRDRKGAQEFAQSVGKAFAWLADVVSAVVRGLVDLTGGLIAVFKAAGTQIGAVGAAITATLRGDFAGAAAIMRDAGETGAAAVARLGTAVGESAARMVLAWTGAGAAYQGYIAALATPASSGDGGGTLTGGGAGTGPGPTDKEIGRQLATELDAIQKAIEAERRRFAIAQEVAQIRTEMDRDRALAAIEAEQRVARHLLETQQITQQQYLEAAMAFEERKYEIRRAAVERQLLLAKAEGRDPAEVERINQQLLALELDYQQRKHAIELEVQQAAGGAGAVGQVAGSAWDAMKQSLGGALESMLTRAKSFGQAMAGVWGNMRAAIVSEIGRILLAKVAAFAKEKLLALAGISASAAKAGAGAAESQASIPYVGPALAVAAMAAIVGAVTGLGSGIKSAAGGYDIPSGINPVTQLHAEEMVLPAEHATTIRELGASGGTQGPPIVLQGVSAGEFLMVARKDLVAVLKSAHRDFEFRG